MVACGFYYLQLTDINNGCENIDTVFVSADFATPVIALAETLELACLETTTELSMELPGDPSEFELLWTSLTGNVLNGATSTTAQIAGLGYYTVTVQDSNNGCETLDSILVTNNQNVPTATQLQLMGETCQDFENGSARIETVEGGQGPYTYTLNDTQSNTVGSFNDLPPGSYDLNIVDALGCSLDTSFIIQPGVDLQLELPPIVEIEQGANENIRGIVNVPETELELIRWSPSELVTCDTCLATQILTEEDQNFNLSIVHNNGCLVMAELAVRILPVSEVFIPNAFSPNGDGNNDFFTIYTNEEIEQIEEMVIFDRWGAVVFRQNNFAPNDPLLGWDGRFKNELLNPSVFVYMIKIREPNGEESILSGDVTIMR
ncbi:MAG: gliding motility-associated C-terminal domain-containing protein [Bacteroidota bacterium]